MVVVLFGLVLAPLTISLKDSLFQVSLLDTSNRVFVGLANYVQLFQDSNVQRAFINTSFYVVVALSLESVLGVLIALALKDNFRFRPVIIAFLILPWALPPLVNGIMWKLIFDPTIGMINSFLINAGFLNEPFVWLNNPSISKVCIIGVHVWKMLPLVSIIFLARMQAIPDEWLEAAVLDGAGKIKRFFTIILPNLKATFIITLSQGCIGAVHLFDEPYAMTGTASDTRSVLIQDYLVAFREFNLGEGMALALVISFSLIVVMAALFAIISWSIKDE